MLAVTTGGALASQRTFETDKSVGMIEYRPASELILVYKPDLGRIEVCGRDWTDRTAVAQVLASEVLGEALSERSPNQRNFDLQPFAATLAPEIPEQLADTITEFRITEARFALGNYDRKVTITALPGEPIAEIARKVLRGLGTEHGRPFLCDVEIFLRAHIPGLGEQAIRFSVSNRNRSNLQSDPDPGKREIGFALLIALGVMKVPSIPSSEEVSELLPGLLGLLAHQGDEISALELRAIGVPVSRLTNLSFLHRRSIASSILIDDDDVGPIEAEVSAEPARGIASLGIENTDVQLRQEGIDEVLSWGINRGYVREAILEKLSPLGIASRAKSTGDGIFSLGDVQLSEERFTVHLWETCTGLDNLEKAIRRLRREPQSGPGLVLTAAPSPVPYLDSRVVLDINDVLDPERRTVDPGVFHQRLREARAATDAGEGITFRNDGETAVLIIPGEQPWTIVGASRVEAVRKLVEAHRQGRFGIRTGELVAHTGSSGPQAVFGPEWKTLIKDRYIHSPKRRFWALKIDPA